MTKLASSLALASTLLSLSCFSVAPASAFSVVTYVSGKGTNTGACATPATACRTFQFAFNQTFPGGEIKALDAADYFSVTINRSVSITGVEGAGILRFTAGDVITINAGASGVVNLSNLTIDGFKTALNGIRLNSGGSLTIKNCTVRNFSGNGIALEPTTALTFLIADTVVTNSGVRGVLINPQGVGGSAKGVLDHVLATKNDSGFVIFTTGGAPADVAAVNSVASDNNFNGFQIQPGTTLRLSHSTATRNDRGVNVDGVARSAGNNFINGNNTADVSGTLTNDGTK